MSRKLCVLLIGTVALTMTAARPAEATTITFDSSFSSQAPPVVDVPPFTRTYSVPNAGGGIFTTQTYQFGGFGLGVPTGNSAPELTIMEDWTQCAISLGTACASGDLSDYLVGSDRFAMIRNGGNFAFTGFDGAQVFRGLGCPGCHEDGSTAPDASFIRVTGFRTGAGQIGTQTFALTSAFQPFTVTGNGWLNTTRVVFEGLDANGNVIDGTGLFGIDNVNATAVPEPASMVLLGSGLVLAVFRRRRNRC